MILIFCASNMEEAIGDLFSIWVRRTQFWEL